MKYKFTVEIETGATLDPDALAEYVCEAIETYDPGANAIGSDDVEAPEIYNALRDGNVTCDPCNDE